MSLLAEEQVSMANRRLPKLGDAVLVAEFFGGAEAEVLLPEAVDEEGALTAFFAVVAACVRAEAGAVPCVAGFSVASTGTILALGASVVEAMTVDEA